MKIIFSLLLITLTAGLKAQGTTILKDFGSFRITMDKKQFFLTPSSEDSSYHSIIKKDVLIENEIILLKRDLASYPYQFSTHYEHQNLECYKMIINKKPESEGANPEFNDKDRAFLLASSDYVKKTKNLLIVNVPVRVQQFRKYLMTRQMEDSLDPNGNYVTEMTDEISGGLFIYDLKTKKVIIDAKGQSILNLNEHGIFFRSVHHFGNSNEYFSMMDWKGNLIMDSIKIRQLMTEDAKLKMIAGNGKAKSIYGKKIETWDLDSIYVDYANSGFHFVNDAGKCGYFSFYGYHLENNYDFLWKENDVYYVADANGLSIVDNRKYDKDSVLFSAKRRIQIREDNQEWNSNHYLDNDTIQNYGRLINFLKTESGYILSKPQKVDFIYAIEREDPMDPSTWYERLDHNGERIVESVMVSQIPFTIFFDSQGENIDFLDSVNLYFMNEDGYLLINEFTQMDQDVLRESRSFRTLDGKRKRLGAPLSDSVFVNHPEFILKSLLQDEFHFVGTLGYPFVVYDYGIFYNYKNSLRVLGDFGHDIDLPKNKLRIDDYVFDFGNKLSVINKNYYTSDSTGRRFYTPVEFDYTKNLTMYKYDGSRHYPVTYPTNYYRKNSYGEEVNYFLSDSLAAINVLSWLEAWPLIEKPDPSDPTTWYESLDPLTGAVNLNYANMVNHSNPLIIYDFKNRKLNKLIQGYNIFRMGNSGMILKKEVPINGGNMENHKVNFYSAINFRGEWVMPEMTESEFYSRLPEFMKAIGIEDFRENSIVRLNTLDENPVPEIICSYELKNGNKSLWLKDYIIQPVTDFNSVILPMNGNGIFIMRKDKGFEVFNYYSDTVIKFKDNYFDLMVDSGSKIAGSDVDEHKNENRRITNPDMEGSFYFQLDNIFFYNNSSNVPYIIDYLMGEGNYHYSDDISKKNYLKSLLGLSGIYNLNTDSWILNPQFDFVTQYKNYFVARKYDLDNTALSLVEIGQNPVYFIFNLEGEEIGSGSPQQIKEKTGIELSEVSIIPKSN